MPDSPIGLGEDAGTPPAAPSMSNAISGLAPVRHYRGVPLDELAREMEYPGAVMLLMTGVTPGPEQLADMQSRWAELEPIDPSVRESVLALPWNVSLLDCLRSGLLNLSHYIEPDLLPEEQCLRLMSELAELIAIRYCATQGVPLPEVAPSEWLTSRLLTQLCGESPSQLDQSALDRFFLVFAEVPGGASTVAVRATSAAGADVASAILCGLSAFEYIAAGETADKAYELLDEIESIDQFEAVADRVMQEESLPPGFAPRAENRDDVPVRLLTETCRQLADDRGQPGYEDLAESFERRLAEERGAAPTILWPTARLFYYLGLEYELLAPLAALGRLPGWCAHYCDQRGKPLR